MPRVSDGGGGLKVAGVYSRLLEYERSKCSKADPLDVLLRHENSASTPRGVFRRPTHRLESLEAGEPTEFPVWMLGGRTEPDERIRRLKRGNRRITAWIVHSDDTVRPVFGERSVRS
jgi:hypothetical protein